MKQTYDAQSATGKLAYKMKQKHNELHTMVSEVVGQILDKQEKSEKAKRKRPALEPEEALKFGELKIEKSGCRSKREISSDSSDDESSDDE